MSKKVHWKSVRGDLMGYFAVPRVVVIHKFDCTLEKCERVNELKNGLMRLKQCHNVSVFIIEFRLTLLKFFERDVHGLQG